MRSFGGPTIWRLGRICLALVAMSGLASMASGPALAVSPAPYLIECRFTKNVAVEYKEYAFLIRLESGIKPSSESDLGDNECRWASSSRPGGAATLTYRTLNFCCGIGQPKVVLAHLQQRIVKLTVTTSFARDAKPGDLDVVSFPR